MVVRAYSYVSSNYRMLDVNDTDLFSKENECYQHQHLHLLQGHLVVRGGGRGQGFCKNCLHWQTMQLWRPIALKVITSQGITAPQT